MAAASKSEIVRARIEPKVKRDAEDILRRLGVTHSTFINMSYRAVVEAGGIPLSLHAPNKETARVLRDARKPGKRARYVRVASLEQLDAAMGRPPKGQPMRRIEFGSAYKRDYKRMSKRGARRTLSAPVSAPIRESW